MAVLDAVSGYANSTSIALFVGLIVVFVIGYKVLQAVMEVFLIAITSGLFYIAMSYVGIAPGLSVVHVLLFMVLGTALYLLYASLGFVAGVISSVVQGGWWVVVKLGETVRSVISWTADLFNDDSSDNESSKRQKKIILDESEDG